MKNIFMIFLVSLLLIGMTIHLNYNITYAQKSSFNSNKSSQQQDIQSQAFISNYNINQVVQIFQCRN